MVPAARAPVFIDRLHETVAVYDSFMQGFVVEDGRMLRVFCEFATFTGGRQGLSFRYQPGEIFIWNVESLSFEITGSVSADDEGALDLGCLHIEDRHGDVVLGVLGGSLVISGGELLLSLTL